MTLAQAQAEPEDTDCGSDFEGLFIPLIIIVSLMLLMSSVTLLILIRKEKAGRPVFAPVGPGTAMVATGTPIGGGGNTVGSKTEEAGLAAGPQAI